MNAPLVWMLLSFALVALAYVRRSAGVFGKHADGRLSWVHTLVLAPYHLLSHLAAYLASSATPYHEVAPGLYLGRRLGGRAARRAVAELELAAVLDLTAEFAEPVAFRRLDYLNLPLLDKTAPTAAQLQAGVDFLKEHHGMGRPVYVHCALGHGRSATFVLAYLGKSEEWLQQIRPGVGLTPEQKKLLQAIQPGPQGPG
ncbi:MAG: dual specificity protein phosphatase family protein [Candidatus Eremiobacteraeota bacterium]|nr:dual specificity protein phosphatase family protein [Candidatus Eremiobacteraeota bacterium]MCW5868684.1 dual specificity protein phosphatase family protein [Candidatus Eremiobacteraeota bacterium]